MRKELDEKLCATYPEIFRDRKAPMTHTCMCWGFDIGDGWFRIVDDLCAALMIIAKREGVEPLVATQVKEKFGGLRFYVQRATDAMHEAINNAENESYRTCEECGKPGVIREGGWVLVRCDEHSDGAAPNTDFWNTGETTTDS